ncbi:hypothetical protein LCM10_03655 [Rossellomorea aquimaris]|uniref:hypothetical protein n=1 Tax=Rossellomorea aquimaris TaxID=189382 RepID=UPI001CD58AD2|nr:hypothetical protein [Rossellomorea aquimaris]MCA1054071.1 hypothetical protein [Rossellomorea aquimaris]
MNLTIFLIMVAMMGCSTNEVPQTPDDQLLVEDWNQLKEERKTEIIKKVYEQERIVQSEENFQERKGFLIALFDKAFTITPDQEENLLEAMKEFIHDRNITKGE